MPLVRHTFMAHWSLIHWHKKNVIVFSLSFLRFNVERLNIRQMQLNIFWFCLDRKRLGNGWKKSKKVSKLDKTTGRKCMQMRCFQISVAYQPPVALKLSIWLLQRTLVCVCILLCYAWCFQFSLSSRTWIFIQFQYRQCASVITELKVKTRVQLHTSLRST